jgi:hypothetical protein
VLHVFIFSCCEFLLAAVVLPLRQFDINVFRASPVSFCVPACVLQDFMRSCWEFVWAIAAGVISVASAMIATAIVVRLINPL